MIRAILFDFGNVVGFFDHRRATKRFAPAAKLSEDEMFDQIYSNHLEHEFESGRMSADEFVAHVTNMIGYDKSHEEFQTAFVDIFTPNPPVMALIPRLKPRYKLVLASNTNELHSAHFRATYADVLRHFDALGMSFEAGVRKPDPEFYRYCARLAGVAPSECLFIDDVEANVEGARAVGMQAIQYSPDIDLAFELARHGVELAPTT
ncbi:MAG: HAD family hydrolase [Gemmataceae bacterium]